LTTGVICYVKCCDFWIADVDSQSTSPIVLLRQSRQRRRCSPAAVSWFLSNDVALPEETAFGRMRQLDKIGSNPDIFDRKPRTFPMQTLGALVLPDH
jgi:hypothetical protein